MKADDDDDNDNDIKAEHEEWDRSSSKRAWSDESGPCVRPPSCADGKGRLILAQAVK